MKIKNIIKKIAAQNINRSPLPRLVRNITTNLGKRFQIDLFSLQDILHTPSGGR